MELSQATLDSSTEGYKNEPYVDTNQRFQEQLDVYQKNSELMKKEDPSARFEVDSTEA